MLQHRGNTCCLSRSVQQNPVLQKPGHLTPHVIVNNGNGTDSFWYFEGTFYGAPHALLSVY